MIGSLLNANQLPVLKWTSFVICRQSHCLDVDWIIRWIVHSADNGLYKQIDQILPTSELCLTDRPTDLQAMLWVSCFNAHESIGLVQQPRSRSKLFKMMSVCGHQTVQKHNVIFTATNDMLCATDRDALQLAVGIWVHPYTAIAFAWLVWTRLMWRGVHLYYGSRVAPLSR